MRRSLSNLFSVDNLNIPLYSPPGKPPKLKNDYGHVSISHCKDALVLAWSKEKICVDVEKNNRKFNAQLLRSKFYSSKENQFIDKLNQKESRQENLSMWILKEAAIKWQEGNILKNLKDWEIDNNYVINKSINLKLKSYLINHSFWKIGLVVSNQVKIDKPIKFLK